MTEQLSRIDAGGRLSAQVNPGVRSATQNRSRILQDKFVNAGRSALIKTPLSHLSVPALAKAANSSVGGFYSRFSDKDAFFEFLSVRMLVEHKKLYDEHLAPDLFTGKTHHDVSTAFVDVMLLVYTGPWRGVLREAYSFISEKPESWGPMLERGNWLRLHIAELYQPMVTDQTDLDERVSAAVQLLFSALNNAMMNCALPFGIEDKAFRHYLILMLDSLITAEPVFNPANQK